MIFLLYMALKPIRCHGAFSLQEISTEYRNKYDKRTMKKGLQIRLSNKEKITYFKRNSSKNKLWCTLAHSIHYILYIVFTLISISPRLVILWTLCSSNSTLQASLMCILWAVMTWQRKLSECWCAVLSRVFLVSILPKICHTVTSHYNFHDVIWYDKVNL